MKVSNIFTATWRLREHLLEMMRITVVWQHRQKCSKHKMQMHSLISSEYILLLHVEKNKMQPIQAKYGAEQFNHGSFFFAHSKHKIGASALQGLGTGKMHKVIKMTFWAYLPAHCRNHAVLISFSTCRGKPF